MNAGTNSVAGILLAGGQAKRFGAPKALLEWDGEPFVRRIARTMLAAGLEPVVAVSGAYPQEVCAALHDLPLEIVHNAEWERGQAGSLRAGLQSVLGRCAAAIFCLTDQPQVGEDILRALTVRFRTTQAPVIIPHIGDRRANPVLFGAQTFEDLLALEGDTGGRALFKRYPVLDLAWQDENLLLDVDTPEDYRRLLAAYGLIPPQKPAR